MPHRNEDLPDTVGQYLLQWLSHARGRVRARTWQGYEGLIRLYALPSIGNLDLVAVQPLDLQHLYSRLLEREVRQLSAGTILNLHLVLHQAFGQAVRWGMIASNPVDGAQPPRPRRPEFAAIDPALVERILSGLQGHPIELAVAIAVATGMRRGEICGLRWSDLDEHLTVAQVRRTLQVARPNLIFEHPKTARSRRTVALPEFLRPYLIAQREGQARRIIAPEQQSTEPSRLVVDGKDGSPLHPDALTNSWRRYVAKAGLPHLRFHDLRHAHATLMLLQGVHPKVVSERLGHSSVGITLDTYSHVLPGMQAEAVRAFDELFPASPTTG